MEDFVTVVDGKVTCATATILTIDLEDIENLRERRANKMKPEQKGKLDKMTLF